MYKSTVINGKRIYPKFYFRWRSMRSRCYKKSSREFKNYGARGITVCTDWQSYKKFHDWCEATIEEGKSIDRIDNDGPYSPANCRWATPLEQQLNSRITPARIKGMGIAKKAAIKALHAKWGNPKTRKEKHCSVCKHLLSIKLFSKNRSVKADGLQKICKECQSARNSR